jgi:hypothetical protein
MVLRGVWGGDGFTTICYTAQHPAHGSKPSNHPGHAEPMGVFVFWGGHMPTAILIDGAYFIKRFRAIEPHNAHNSERAADCIFRWAVAHLSVSGTGNGGVPRRQNRRELYRIFFYDCPPLEKKLHNPISKRAVDFAKSDEAVFRLSLHQRLLSKRKLALRLGHLSTDTPWTIKPRVIADFQEAGGSNSVDRWRC